MQNVLQNLLSLFLLFALTPEQLNLCLQEHPGNLHEPSQFFQVSTSYTINVRFERPQGKRRNAETSFLNLWWGFLAKPPSKLEPAQGRAPAALLHAPLASQQLQVKTQLQQTSVFAFLKVHRRW